MNHGSLFSGIGGFDLAANTVGWNNIFQCEINEFCQKVLRYHFPQTILYEDIKKTNFSIHRGAIDVLSGGFPCQPYSVSGKRLGKNDERHLFPEMLRAIEEIEPTWVVGENVRGLVSWNEGLVYHEIYDDLESKGYETQSFLIPAASVGAPHQRYRIFFVAYNVTHAKSKQSQQLRPEQHQISKQKQGQFGGGSGEMGGRGLITDTSGERLEGETAVESLEGNERFGGHNFKEHDAWKSFPTKSPICGGNDGIPRELDAITFPQWRKESLIAYGNAIVPQIALEIFKTIQKTKDIIQ